MTALSALGMVVLLTTSALGHIVLVYGAYRFWRQFCDDATRGHVERNRDVAEMARMREGLTK